MVCYERGTPVNAPCREGPEHLRPEAMRNMEGGVGRWIDRGQEGGRVEEMGGGVKGGREGGRDGGREAGREKGRKRGSEGGREGRKDGGIKGGTHTCTHVCLDARLASIRRDGRERRSVDGPEAIWKVDLDSELNRSF